MLFLFIYLDSKGTVVSKGEMECVGYQTRVAPDVKGLFRVIVEFKLKPVQ